jgi:WD40 repeat protein
VCPGCGSRLTVGSAISDAGTQPAHGPKAADRPATIGRFQVRGKLGAGAFGTVYRAYDPQLDREVALKVPHPGVFDSQKRIDRFLREAKAAAGLRHPHIVPVYDAGAERGRHYIAAAFIPGRKLADVIGEADGGLDFARAARLARELAEALAYAHAVGVIHRDVKPDNVMLDPADRVHLMDFGLAARQDEGGSRLTADGAVMGTPAYMAPEQAEGRATEVGPPADQYACGVVLYELLTGRVPFEGPIPAVIHHQIRTDPEPPSKFRPGVPRDLETVCLKCLEKSPARRYLDCQALADDLRRWLDGDPVSARRLSPAERLARWARRNRAVAGLTGAVAAALLLGASAATYFAVRASAEAAHAETARRDAEDTAAREATERERADRKAGELAREGYKHRVSLAYREWVAGNSETAEALLAGCPAGRRGWEWRYCRGLVQGGGTSFTGHRGPIVGLTTWADRAATAAQDGTVRVWDPATGRETAAPLAGHRMSNPQAWQGTFGILSASADGTRLAGLVSEAAVAVWETATGREVARLPLKSHDIRHVRLSPDGRTVLTATGSDAQLWDADTGRPGHSLSGHRYPLAEAAFNPAGDRVATASFDSTARVWDVASGRLVRTLAHDTIVQAVAFHPAGRLLATAGFDGLIRVWDTQTGRVAVTCQGHPGIVRCLAFSPDGTRIASGGEDRSVRVWDAATGVGVQTFRAHRGSLVAVAYAAADRLISAGSDGQVRVWDPGRDQEAIAVPGVTVWTRAAGFRPDGAVLAVGGADYLVRLLDVASGREVSRIKGHRASVMGLAYSPDGRRIATARGDWLVRIWDVESKKALFDLPAPAIPAKMNYGPSVAFGPDGRWAVAGCADKTVRVWNLADRSEATVFRGHQAFVTSVAVLPGDRIASQDITGSVRVWERATGREVRTFQVREGFFTQDMAVSPDGTRLAVPSGNEVRVFDLDSGRVALTLRGHAGTVSTVAFTPDGSRLLSGSYDTTIRLWDTAIGDELFVLRGHRGGVLRVRVDRDGRRVASTGIEGGTRIWDAPPPADAD